MEGKPMKKLIALFLSAVLCAGLLAGCTGSTQTGGDDSLAGKHVFMFKSTGNTFGDLMYQGFKQYMESQGQQTVYKSPSETTVEAQVKLIEELIIQKVASITISTNGDAGYDTVLEKAKNAGIKVISVDSKVDKDYRITHIDPTSQAGIGQSLVQAATLIALGKDYPTDTTLKEATDAALAEYSGEVINLGVLSASIDTPVQNGWIDQMKKELTRDVYQGKVNPELDIKYGNDDLTISTTQANAFIAEDKVDVIISPTTIGVAAAGQALKSSNSSIKLTGLGLPSEMKGFMPNQASDNAFDYVCPYMMLWDVIDLGYVSGVAALAACEGKYDGSIGAEITVPAYGEYEERTLTTTEHEDGGTTIVIGDPYAFYKDNMASWVDVL